MHASFLFLGEVAPSPLSALWGELPGTCPAPSELVHKRKPHSRNRTACPHLICFPVTNMDSPIAMVARAVPNSRGRRTCPSSSQPMISVAIMSVAVLVTAETTRGITVAQAAAANDVGGPGSELSAVQDGKQSSATHLPRDCGQRILRAGRASGGVLRGIVHARAGAAIGVAHQYPPKLVHRNVIEVEQVPARVAAALVPNT